MAESWNDKGVFKFFDFGNSLDVAKDKKIVGKCSLCPGHTSISGRIGKTSNFVLHLRVSTVL